MLPSWWASRGRVEVNDRTNFIIVEAVPQDLVQVREVIRRLDRSTDQIAIETRIVEAANSFCPLPRHPMGWPVELSTRFATLTGLPFPNSVIASGEQLDQQLPGIVGVEKPLFAVNLPASGGGGALGLQLGSAGSAVQVNLRLSAGETSGTAKVISSPKVTTTNHTEARIKDGMNLNVGTTSAQGTTVTQVESGLEMIVTPHVNSDDMVRMNLQIIKSEPDFSQAVNGIPSIITKETQTEVMVPNAETVVLGGIFRRRIQTGKTEVPGLSKVPLIGYLFSKTDETDDRSETLIFITPRLVRREPRVAEAD